MTKKRLVSGMRTTGSLHLGHLEGTLKNWVSLQDKYDCFFFAAVWHAFTDRLKIDDLPDIIDEMIVDWLSVGINPEKAVIFRQSSMHEHAELSTILSMFTPLGWLERCPTFKSQIRNDSQRGSLSIGKLMYPVLMTADIATYKSEIVPVGQDQIPHLELSREIIRKFNGQYGKILKEPDVILSKVPLLKGIDKRKMSKSYNNGIDLRETPEGLKKKIQMMITDPQRVRRNDPGDPEVCAVYDYHKIYSPSELDEISDGCKTAKIGCRDCKMKLYEKLNNILEPYRVKRAELEKTPDYIHDILNEGEKKAHIIAEQTMLEIRKAMGFIA